jgi:hypothetical protein
MLRGPYILSLASILIFSGTAFADQFYFESPGTTVWDGVYVNPYYANDNTQKQNNPLTIFCDDWNTDFSGNPTWNANVYTLTASNDSYFKYGEATQTYNVTLHGPGGASDYLSVALGTIPTPFDRYLEAAWLDNQWLTALTNGTGSANMQKEIAAAIWTLFVDTSHVGTPGSDPTDGLVGAINASGYADAVNTYLSEAEGAVTAGYNAPGWDVIVPTNNSFAMQEFLVHGFTGDTVPEPGAVVLFGTVVAILGFTKLRRV